MRTLFAIVGGALLLAGCAHDRGSTGDVYYSTDSGMGASSSDTQSSTNQDNHIERARQPEYPSESQPRFDKF